MDGCPAKHTSGAARLSIMSEINIFYKSWEPKVRPRWFSVQENATFCLKNRKNWINNPGAAMKNYPHYPNRAIRPSRQVRIPPQVIVLTSDLAGEKVATLPWRQQLTGRCWSSGTLSHKSMMMGEETAECHWIRLWSGGLTWAGLQLYSCFVINWTKSVKIILELIGWFMTNRNTVPTL